MREVGAPEDVFQVATGDGETGGALVDEVDVVMFTGSTRTGKKVLARAADTLTPVYLELGGKDPMIVLSDADLERAANGAIFYSMQNAGQTCISVERVYVEEPVYDEFVGQGRPTRREALRQGEPPGPARSTSARSSSRRRSTSSRTTSRTRSTRAPRCSSAGARVEGDGGRFFEPTVLVDVDHSMEAMTEETFGPTLPIMKVRDAEEALRLANDSPYGLAGVGVDQGRRARRGVRPARRGRRGDGQRRELNYAALELPMGGWKTSGLGSRHGAGGIRKYCASRPILVKRSRPRRTSTCSRTRRGRRGSVGRLFTLLYGRGKRD